MSLITDYEETKVLEERIKAARREVRETKALKRVVDFWGNPIRNTEGKLMFLTDMYRVEFFSEEETLKYFTLNDTIDIEVVRRLFKE